MIKLYVVVREDLKGSQKTVQAIHGAAEYLIRNKDTSWDNGTVVCLKAKNEDHLNTIKNILDKKDISYNLFREPDLKNSLTSLAVVLNSRNNCLSNLPLL